MTQRGGLYLLVASFFSFRLTEEVTHLVALFFPCRRNEEV
jgi:hypothetical protein